jgi:hypothetical protein
VLEALSKFKRKMKRKFWPGMGKSNGKLKENFS